MCRPNFRPSSGSCFTVAYREPLGRGLSFFVLCTVTIHEVLLPMMEQY